MSNDLIRRAMEAGDLTFRLGPHGGAEKTARAIVEAVVPAIRAAVLEEAAGVCAQAAMRLLSNSKSRVNQVDRHTAYVLQDKAAAIRALAARGDADHG
jgi:hypothetical protein